MCPLRFETSGFSGRTASTRAGLSPGLSGVCANDVRQDEDVLVDR